MSDGLNDTARPIEYCDCGYPVGRCDCLANEHVPCSPNQSVVQARRDGAGPNNPDRSGHAGLDAVIAETKRQLEYAQWRMQECQDVKDWDGAHQWASVAVQLAAAYDHHLAIKANQDK